MAIYRDRNPALLRGILPPHYDTLESAHRDRIVVSIDEGPRFTCGELRIEAPFGFDRPQLYTWLSAQQPPANAIPASVHVVAGVPRTHWIAPSGAAAELDEPTWQPGKPAEFTDLAHDHYDRQVRRALAAMGWYHAKFESRLVRDKASQTAALLISIQDHGPLTRIDRIEVEGSQRDSQEDVIAFLGLQAGLPLNEGVRLEIAYRLWHSARYIDQNVTIEPPVEPAGPTVLRIKLVDNDWAPPLLEPLNAAQETLIRFRDWLQEAVDRRDSLIIRLTTRAGFWQIVAAHDEGLLVTIEPRPNALGVVPENAHPFLLVSGYGAVECVARGHSHKLQIPIANATQLLTTITARAQPKASNAERPFTLSLGMGAAVQRPSTTVGPLAPLKLDLTLDASVLMALLDPERIQSTLNNDQLVLLERNGNMQLRIEQRTGRLIDWSLRANEDDRISATISFDSTPFADHVAVARHRLNGDAAPQPNAFDPRWPVSSTADYLLGTILADEAVDWFSEDKVTRAHAEEMRAIMHKLVRSGLLSPLDELALAEQRAPEQKFGIPASSDDQVDADEVDSLSTSSIIVRAVAGFSDEMFPRDSWIWTLTRRSAFLLLHHTEFTKEDLKKLYYSDDVGPLARLTTATLLDLIKHPSATRFARSGRRKLDVKDFRNDYQPLIATNKLVGRVVFHAAAALRQLDDSEVKTLGRSLLGPHGNLLEEGVKYLRENRDRPLEESLPIVLDRAWGQGLRAWVDNRLEQLELSEAAVVRKPKAVTLTQ